jgi:hypothetical protein
VSTGFSSEAAASSGVRGRLAIWPALPRCSGQEIDRNDVLLASVSKISYRWCLGRSNVYAVRGRFNRNRLASNRRVSPAGFAALMFAAWCQILLVVTLAHLPQAQAADALDCIRMCHPDDDGSPAPKQQDHSGHDCVLCIMCVGHAAQAALVSSPPVLPDRPFITLVLLDAYRPRAPPVKPVLAAQPRGPPALI